MKITISNKNPRKPRAKSEPDVFLYEREGEIFLFDAHVGLFFKLNVTAATIWKLSDGEHTIEDIVNYICKDYDMKDVNRVKKDVVKALKELERRNWIIWK